MNQHHLETTDLFKGAFFLCMGGSLTCLRVEYNGRQTATFLITGDDLDRHNADYMTGRALVNPMQLKNSLNHLRDQLFNKLREKENRDYADKKENRAGANRRHQNPNRHHRAY